MTTSFFSHSPVGQLNSWHGDQGLILDRQVDNSRAANNPPRYGAATTGPRWDYGELAIATMEIGPRLVLHRRPFYLPTLLGNPFP